MLATHEIKAIKLTYQGKTKVKILQWLHLLSIKNINIMSQALFTVLLFIHELLPNLDISAIQHPNSLNIYHNGDKYQLNPAKPG